MGLGNLWVHPTGQKHHSPERRRLMHHPRRCMGLRLMETRDNCTPFRIHRWSLGRHSVQCMRRVRHAQGQESMQSRPKQFKEYAVWLGPCHVCVRCWYKARLADFGPLSAAFHPTAVQHITIHHALQRAQHVNTLPYLAVVCV